MAGARRAAPPTHPSVWAGLALATVGLLVAVYAYTGSRVYDIAYFFVAILGGFLAFSGILTAAWGRAIAAARRTRRPTSAAATASSPTVAAPQEKRGMLPGLGRRAKAAVPGVAKSAASAPVPPAAPLEAPAKIETPVAAAKSTAPSTPPRAESKGGPLSAFARKPKEAKPAPTESPAPPAPVASEPKGPFAGFAKKAKTSSGKEAVPKPTFAFRRRGDSAGSSSTKDAAAPTAASPSPAAGAPASTAAPAQAADEAPGKEPAPAPAPAIERLTVQCPGCAKQFTVEGARPLTIKCPACGLSGTA